MSEFKDHHLGVQTRENLLKAQNHMKDQFDRKGANRHFVVVDRVLVLLSQGLRASFCGHCTVLKKVGDENYVISTPEDRQKTRLCHINLLQKCQGWSCEPAVACEVS